MSQFSETDKAILNCIFNPSLPLDDAYNEDLSNILKDEEELTEQGKKAKEIEVEGIRAAEEGKLTLAVEIMTKAVGVAETASGYNNRAQVYRLLGDDIRALEDLENSLKLSGKKGKSGRQALCQRGILYRKREEDDKARKDFRAAAQLGSSFAKQQLFEMNPYAAMCNQMVNQMMNKLASPKTD